MAGRSGVVLELEQLAFIDVAGSGMITEAERSFRVQGRAFSVRLPQPQVGRLLQRAGVA